MNLGESASQFGPEETRKQLCTKMNDLAVVIMPFDRHIIGNPASFKRCASIFRSGKGQWKADFRRLLTMVQNGKQTLRYGEELRLHM